jgi:hypothetical protein
LLLIFKYEFQGNQKTQQDSSSLSQAEFDDAHVLGLYGFGPCGL